MRQMIGTFAVLAILLAIFAPAQAAVPVNVLDSREASFVKPPEEPAPDEAIAADHGDEAAPSAEEREEQQDPPLPLSQEEKKQGPESQTPVVIQAPTPLLSGATTPVVAKATPSPSETLSPEKSEPVVLAAPVDKAAIPDVSPESFGLLSDQDGGLGAAMWKGTSRRMIDRLLPALSLPTASSALNDLARRFLLTVAAVPEDREQGARPLPDLVSMRVEKLLSLGRVGEAWELSSLATRGKVDQIALRQVTEAVLVKDPKDEKAICSQIPGLVAAYSKGGEAASEWQKALIYCQLKDGEKQAAQLSLDLLREQNVKDDLFFDLVGNNVLKGRKKLPEALDPLRPLTFGILRLMGAAVPASLYDMAPAAVMPEILLIKAEDDKARLARAERAAATGEISATQLGAVYKSVSFEPETFAALPEEGPREVMSRALFYQAAVAAAPQERATILHALLGSARDADLAGGFGKLLAELAASIPVGEENGIFAAQAARLFALAGQPDRAAAWLKFARVLAPRFAEIGVQIAGRWPLFVLSGLEPDGDYARGMTDWLLVALMPGSVEQNRLRRDYAARVLMILSAAGYAVPEEAWLRVADVSPAAQRLAPSPFLLERLALVSQGERRGETVLLSLLTAGPERQEMPLGVRTEIVRALRRAGLLADAQAFARESVADMVMP